MPQVPHAARSSDLEPAAADHRVEFYADDETLVRSVVDFLHPALADGTAIIIAEEDHRDAFIAGLRGCETDATAAIDGGRLIVLDAGELLEQFMVEDMPDLAAFHEVIGAVLARAAGNAGPVRVYGEMVAVLWDAGRVPAAMRLEELWNQLGASHSFALLCGYPATLFTHPGASRDFATLCDHHTAVAVPDAAAMRKALPAGPATPTQERAIGWHFPPELTSGARARQRLRAILAIWQLVDVLDDAELLATELVNNAVMHARTEVLVTVSQRRGVLRVEVTDVGQGTFRPDHAGLTATHGRGLMLVEAISSAWGTAVTDETKTVWFELQAHTAA